MKCALCDKDITNYNPASHQLKIDQDHAVDICDSCIDKFVQWNGRRIATLFPTKALKKRYL